MARVTYTPKIGRYLRDNYESKTITELANEIGCGLSSVQRWSRRLGLTGKKRGNPHRDKKVVEIPPPVVRRGYEYSNITHEQHIDRILNMAI